MLHQKNNKKTPHKKHQLEVSVLLNSGCAMLVHTAVIDLSKNLHKEKF